MTLYGVLLSLDIDGTLECGAPPGPLTRGDASAAIQAGAIVGSASDRTPADQWRVWRAWGVEPSFVVPKHGLPRVVARYPGLAPLHVGDGYVDWLEASRAGFAYLHIRDVDRGLVEAVRRWRADPALGAGPWLEGVPDASLRLPL